jgi:protein-disulfide isomerase
VIKDPKNLEELARKTGGRATPTLIIGGEVIVGFEQAEVERALRKAGIA